ncbi:uncharacterized protein LOC132499915 [Mesoplodon densirostris]|uniref:uncharacterized protein LOC132499914 n=1 Tax=Mesoplodon densirostris TaxID=48708 RepID=UPI0028DCCAFD|nr:uncharacterized protein LOC132499914 [Mesoplodon densirostris]XP_059970562.1 uncharacterized protein LOC132499915 [Mesoplodon densirostris]
MAVNYGKIVSSKTIALATQEVIDRKLEAKVDALEEAILHIGQELTALKAGTPLPRSHPFPPASRTGASRLALEALRSGEAGTSPLRFPLSPACPAPRPRAQRRAGCAGEAQHMSIELNCCGRRLYAAAELLSARRYRVEIYGANGALYGNCGPPPAFWVARGVSARGWESRPRRPPSPRLRINGPPAPPPPPPKSVSRSPRTRARAGCAQPTRSKRGRGGQGARGTPPKWSGVRTQIGETRRESMTAGETRANLFGESPLRHPTAQALQRREIEQSEGFRLGPPASQPVSFLSSWEGLVSPKERFLVEV